MKNKLYKLLLIIFVIIYICSYFVSENGYYEYTLSKETTITNDKIKEFDKLVQSGEVIDMDNYLNKKEIDYTNKFSNMMYGISKKSDKIVKKYLKKLFRKLGEVVLEDD